MYKLLFHPGISAEVKSSYKWYEEQTDGLGDDFLSELESAYQAIIELPQTWPILKKNFRRYLLSRFPFSIIYRKTENLIFVVAVMHNSRKPGYWINRI